MAGPPAHVKYYSVGDLAAVSTATVTVMNGQGAHVQQEEEEEVEEESELQVMVGVHRSLPHLQGGASS